VSPPIWQPACVNRNSNQLGCTIVFVGCGSYGCCTALFHGGISHQQVAPTSGAGAHGRVGHAGLKGLNALAQPWALVGAVVRLSCG
jgi:hypothetical protein